MELTFEKVGNQYVAEFQAPSDFNLHIEREEIGVLEVHQRGSEEGKYDFAWSTGVNGRKVVDYDFGALVYPKYIKVVSGSEVVSASVNFNEGGGSGSESGEVSSIEYLDVSGMEYSPGNEKAFLLMASFLIKVKINNNVIISTYGLGTITNGDTVRNNTISIAVDFSTIVSNGTQKSTLGEAISSMVDIDSIPRLTKEEFYNLEA